MCAFSGAFVPFPSATEDKRRRGSLGPRHVCSLVLACAASATRFVHATVTGRWSLQRWTQESVSTHGVDPVRVGSRGRTVAPKGKAVRGAQAVLGCLMLKFRHIKTNYIKID